MHLRMRKHVLRYFKSPCFQSFRHVRAGRFFGVDVADDKDQIFILIENAAVCELLCFKKLRKLFYRARTDRDIFDIRNMCPAAAAFEFRIDKLVNRFVCKSHCSPFGSLTSV